MYAYCLGHGPREEKRSDGYLMLRIPDLWERKEAWEDQSDWN